MTSLVRDVVVACLAYLLFVYGAGLALSILAFFENRSRVRESEAEGWDTIGRSRFTIPVSVIAPMHNEEVLGVPAVEALAGATPRSSSSTTARPTRRLHG